MRRSGGRTGVFADLRRRPFELNSSLAAEEFERRLLHVGLTEARHRRWKSMSWPPGTGGTIFSRMLTDTICVTWHNPRARHSYQPVFRGMVEPGRDGSKLVGTIGRASWLTFFAITWILPLLAITVTMAVLTAASAIRQEWSEFAERVPFVLVPLALLAFGYALHRGLMPMARRDEAQLIAWIEDRAGGSTGPAAGVTTG